MAHRTFIRLYRVACLAAVLVAASVGGASAQSPPGDPKIGIIDVQRILSDSKAAKGIRPEIERLRREFQEQVKEQERVLREAEQELTQQRAILSRDAFAEKRRAFSEQASEAQRDVQERRRRLDEAFNDTKNVILKNLIVVAQDVAKEKDLNIVLEKRFVFLSAKTLDVTDTILARLNKRLPTVSIELGAQKKDQGGSKGQR
jgi:outer membrane protein